jgi:hypothetical protein
MDGARAWAMAGGRLPARVPAMRRAVHGVALNACEHGRPQGRNAEPSARPPAAAGSPPAAALGPVVKFRVYSSVRQLKSAAREQTFQSRSGPSRGHTHTHTHTHTAHMTHGARHRLTEDTETQSTRTAHSGATSQQTKATAHSKALPRVAPLRRLLRLRARTVDPPKVEVERAVPRLHRRTAREALAAGNTHRVTI